MEESLWNRLWTCGKNRQRDYVEEEEEEEEDYNDDDMFKTEGIL